MQRLSLFFPRTTFVNFLVRCIFNNVLLWALVPIRHFTLYETGTFQAHVLKMLRLGEFFSKLLENL